MIYIPNRETKKLVQTNRGKFLGDLWSTFNVDIQSDKGIVKVSPRTKVNTSSADDADLGVPIGFIRFQSRIFTVAGTRVFISAGDTPDEAFTEDASTNAQTDYSADLSDINLFNGVLVTTTQDAVMSLNAASGGTWTSRASISSATPHPMAVFKKFNRLYYANASDTVLSLDTSWSEATTGNDYAIDLGDNNGSYITSLRTTTTDVWIGTMSRTGYPRGNIYRWDGLSAQVTQEYILNAQGCMALAVKGEVVYAMDSNGVLLKFTGYSFEEVGRLPMSKSRLKNINSTSNDRFIHPNGMIVTENDTILCLVNNEHEDNGTTIDENFPSGVWEWSEENGFIHKYSFSYNPEANSTITDYGQNRVARVGGIANVNWPSTDADRNGTIMLGAQYYTNSSSTAYGIFLDDSNDTVQKYGYFVTSWIQSPNLKEKWQKIAARYRKFLDSDDSIALKYRITEAEPTYITLTWTSTSTFTTTTDLTDYVGYEVEIIQGTGSGKCAHIVQVTGSSTYTVVLDDTFTGVTTGTAKARVQDWKLINQLITGQTHESTKQRIDRNSERIQFKCCMQFTGEDELHELAIIHEALEELT